MSTSASPTNVMDWDTYLVPMTVPGGDSDYATLGTDTNGIYISVLHRGMGTNMGHTVVGYRKPEIYAGTVVPHRRDLTTALDLKVWTIQPAVKFDSSSTNDYAWLLAKGPPQLGSNYRGGAILYRRMWWTNSPTNALAIEADWQVVAQSSDVDYRDYFDIEGTNQVRLPTTPTLEAPQKGGSQKINLTFTGSRLMNAVIRDGLVYTCQHIGLSGTGGSYSGDETGSNVDRSGVQRLKLRLEVDGTLSYYRHGRIYDTTSTNAMYYYFPSIAVNCTSDMVLGFSGSSATNYVSAFYAWHPGVGVINPSPVLLKEGEGYFPDPLGQLGDYSFTTLDPSDSLSLWTVQEYVDDEQNWATWIGKIIRK